MIIVTGAVRVRPESLVDALALSLAHVRRSRQEPGCLRHGVHQDVEDPTRLVFVEHWDDRSALDAHFRVAASGEFVRELTALALDAPEMHISVVA